MTLPRDVAPGRYYLITRRCTQRQFLLRPDDFVNQIFTYCLICAARRFGVEIVGTCAMSNHHHTVIYDRSGNYPAFLEHFHKFTAKCLNAYRGRWENFWSSEQVCVVRLEAGEDLLAKLVYLFTNPIKDHLVDSVKDWPGVNSYCAFLAGEPLRADRPEHFFTKDGKMDETVELELYVPPELGEREQVLRTIRERVEAQETALRKQRAREGRTVLGPRRIKKQDFNSKPESREPRRTMRPRIAAQNKWARLERIQRNYEFLEAYETARLDWLAGRPAEFPVGTYWLRRFAAVPIANS